MKHFVSLNGGTTYQAADSNGVRLLYEGVAVDDEHGSEGDLHLIASLDGVVADVWAQTQPEHQHMLGTSWETVNDIVERLTGNEPKRDFGAARADFE